MIDPYTAAVLAELLDATRKIEAFLQRKISFERFFREYSNFYYAAALDGHESNPAFDAILTSVQPAVQIHERVQNLINRIHFAPDAEHEIYRRAGRLRPDEVEAELRERISIEDVTRVADELRRRINAPS